MDRKEILTKLAAGEISPDDADKQLAALETAPPRGQLYCKVSLKGGMSLYGLQRMPVTLYVEQWERLLAYSDEIRKFLAEHQAELKRKER